MMLKLLPVLILAGCTAVAPFNPNKDYLKRCETPPELAGKDGKSIIAWAESAGPGIAECVRNHNALVTIIEAQQ